MVQVGFFLPPNALAGIQTRVSQSVAPLCLTFEKDALLTDWTAAPKDIVAQILKLRNGCIPRISDSSNGILWIIHRRHFVALADW